MGVILPPSRPEGTMRAGGTGRGVAGRRGHPQSVTLVQGCANGGDSGGTEWRNKSPISLFSYPPLSLGFPNGEPDPRPEIRGQGHSTQRSVSRAWRGWQRAKNEPRRVKGLSGIASTLDLARVWEKEFLGS